MDYAAILGHFHPLAVHLPIGFLCAGVLAALFSRFEKYAGLRPAVPFLLFWGAISAAASCLLGYLLSLGGDYDPDLLFKHQWAGIACAVASALGYLGYRSRHNMPGLAKGVLWVLIGGTTAVAGHYGGSLTHGEGYLMEAWRPQTLPAPGDLAPIDTLSAQKPAAPESSETTLKPTPPNGIPPAKPVITYTDLVAPILKAKCYRCHNASKQKGGLRLDNPAGLLKGGKNGSVLSPGEPDKSPMFVNCTLPLEDEAHMPPKGKPQLTTQELAVLRKWIGMGAPFGPTTTALGSPPLVASDNIQPETVREMPPPAPTTRSTETLLLEQKVPPASAAALEKLTALRIIAASLGENNAYLAVNFVNVKSYEPAMLDALLPLRAQILHLRLSNQAVTDKDLAKIASLKNLTRLNLEKSRVTDAGLAHLKRLPYLEQLNLYGVRVTDKGLFTLADCKKLKRLYLWDTQTTQKGINALRKALPGIEIISGAPHFEKPDTLKTKAPTAN